MMDSDEMNRTLHWSLRHVLEHDDQIVRQLAARFLLKLDDVHTAELLEIVLNVEDEEAQTAFARLRAERPQGAFVAHAYCQIMWRVPEFAERAASALLETAPNSDTYHAVIGAKSVSQATRRQAWERLRPMVSVHDVVRLYEAAQRKADGTTYTSESAAFARESFDALLARGVTNEDLRILCLYVAEISSLAWQILLARGPTKEDLEWLISAHADQHDEAKALLARGEYADAPKA